MRTLNYRVKKVDGTEFHTTSYIVASEAGNRMVETYLTPVKNETEEDKKALAKNREKFQEYLAKKRKSKQSNI